MAQVDASDGRYELFHYRDREKREIDFLIEREDNALLGIEIKETTPIHPDIVLGKLKRPSRSALWKKWLHLKNT